MNVCYLTKYTEKGASSRYRTFQFLPYLKEKGIEYHVFPFFQDIHIDYINQKRRIVRFSTLLLVLKRIKILFHLKEFEIFWIEKEAIPYFPGIFEYILSLKKIRYILDYDDAIYHNYDQAKNRIVKLVLKDKIPKIMKRAKAIIVANHYIEKYANSYNQNIYYIPTVLDHNKYDLPINTSGKTKFIIGWIGSASTSKFLIPLLPGLVDFCKDNNALLHLVGFDKSLLSQNFDEKFIKVIKWDPNTEIENLSVCNVGIAPLQDTLFAKGKSAFKIIQYMAIGLPVVVSPIGANKDVVENGKNGFWATNTDEWKKYLKILKDSPDLCFKISQQNKEKIKKEFSIQCKIPLYLEILEKFSKKNIDNRKTNN